MPEKLQRLSRVSKPTTTKIAAKLVITDADTMTKEQRVQVAAWLRQKAQELRSEGDQYASRFTARFHWWRS